MAVRIIIAGVLGRMGREIASIVLRDPECILAGCTERPSHPSLGTDPAEYLGCAKTGVTIQHSLHAIDCRDAVIIDFTSPEATRDHLQEIKKNLARIVIGTTGLSGQDMKRVEEAATAAAVLHSPNMSVGVNFLFYLTKIAAERLGDDFDIEIIEAHHHFKKDAPSGTARRLGEIAASARGNSYGDVAQNGRNGMVGERTRKEIGMHAVRGGDIVGEHTVLFAGTGERIELKHCAQSRTNLAQGAVRAAKWLGTKPPGLYTMQDVLGF
jgi:4-hydroxy-tetrahydrodipicolinate reductase